MNRLPFWKRVNLIIIGSGLVILLVNFVIWKSADLNVKKLDNVYGSNVSLSELTESLEKVQASMELYLERKTSSTMEEFYSDADDLEGLIYNLEDVPSNNESKLMEKNIKNLTSSYLNVTYQTVQAKQNRNVEEYKERSEEASRKYGYIRTYIYSLNNVQFRNNSSKYNTMLESFHYSEAISMIVMLAMIVVVLLIMSVVVRRMTALEESREKLKIKNALSEKEHEMESSIKDAELMYLQAQIHPHFLFNSLNAGAQLAMLENAGRSYDYLQNLSEFFRYNLKRRDEVTLEQEVDQIDHYIYVLNVRFAGDIQYSKSVDERLLDLRMPGMILQPIVENCVNYGIRNIDREKKIEIEVSSMDDKVCICVRDNGIGIAQETIERIMNGKSENSEDPGSNGVGLVNVISRLKLYYNAEDIFTIQSLGENVGTEVILYLPYNGEKNLC